MEIMHHIGSAKDTAAVWTERTTLVCKPEAGTLGADAKEDVAAPLDHLAQFIFDGGYIFSQSVQAIRNVAHIRAERGEFAAELIDETPQFV
jgi:hypothetical protein